MIDYTRLIFALPSPRWFANPCWFIIGDNNARVFAIRYCNTLGSVKLFILRSHWHKLRRYENYCFMWL